MLLCLGKIWGVPSNTAGVPKTWNVSCWIPAMGNSCCHGVRSQTRKQRQSWVLVLAVSSASKNLELLMVLWGVFSLLLLSVFFSPKILKWILNKTLIPRMMLSFNSVYYLSHDCLLLSLITLKLAGPILLSHINLHSLLNLSVNLSLRLLFLGLIFVVWRVTGSLHYRGREQVTMEDVKVIREQELEC